VNTPPDLRHLAERCRKMAETEFDPRIRSKLLEMAVDYEHKAGVDLRPSP